MVTKLRNWTSWRTTNSGVVHRLARTPMFLVVIAKQSPAKASTVFIIGFGYTPERINVSPSPLVFDYYHNQGR